jgi:putative addiction module CopG family antidote
MLQIDLTPQRQEFADRLIAEGRYSDIDGVISAALRLLQVRGDAEPGQNEDNSLRGFA